MKRIFLILLLLILTTVISYSQKVYSKLPSKVLRVHFMPLGGGVEMKLSGNNTLFLDGGFGLSAAFQRPIGENDYTFTLRPTTEVQLRNYFSMKARKKNELMVDYFSGYYMAFIVRNKFKTQITENKLIAGGVFGFQRVLGTDLYFNLGLGIGVAYKPSGIKFGIFPDAKFGFFIGGKD